MVLLTPLQNANLARKGGAGSIPCTPPQGMLRSFTETGCQDKGCDRGHRLNGREIMRRDARVVIESGVARSATTFRTPLKVCETIAKSKGYPPFRYPQALARLIPSEMEARHIPDHAPPKDRTI